MKRWIAICTALALIVGCGDNNDGNNDTGNNTENNTTGDTSSNNTTGDTSTNNTTGETSANNTTGETSTTSRLEAHGCTFDTAMDATGQATVSISDIAAWSVPHEVCVRVDAGTEVTWDGNFDAHPLEGGVSPEENTDNPIDVAADGVTGNDSVSVTLEDAGDYPYFCGIHTTSMVGVIYVD